MRRFRKRLSARFGVNPESGAAIVLVAVSMTILLGFAAFAVDFGWLYLNGIRIQHGADAAALAGVVYEPGDQTTAYREARESAFRHHHPRSRNVGENGHCAKSHQ